MHQGPVNADMCMRTCKPSVQDNTPCCCCHICYPYTTINNQQQHSDAPLSTCPLLAAAE